MPPRGIQRKLMKKKNRNFVCQKNADSGTIVFRFVISVLVLAKYVTEKGNRDPEFFHPAFTLSAGTAPEYGCH